VGGSDGVSGAKKYVLNRWRKYCAHIALKLMKERRQGVFQGFKMESTGETELDGVNFKFYLKLQNANSQWYDMILL